MVSVLRPGQRILSIPGYGVQTSRRAVASGAAAWWLAGGAPTPIAAYQPKGAASLAASYVNLVNPGTYDAAPGVAPTLDASGWVFNGSSQYLTTGIIPASNQTWTVIARYSNQGAASYGGLVGNGSAGNLLILETRRVGTNARMYFHGTTSASGGAFSSSGVMAIAGRQGYHDGVADGAVLAVGTTGTPGALLIATLDGVNYFLACKIQAVAVYDTSTGHATWVPAVMAACALI